MPAAVGVNIQQFIDTQRISPFQLKVMALCFLVGAVDGFDPAAVGYIAPALKGQWKLAPTQLSSLFGAGLFGLMAGALLFGPLADKVGRRAVLVIATLFFGIASIASATSNSIEALTIWRFVTGIGLGGAMPAAITLTSEYCPTKTRSLLVTTMFCGFTLGAALGGAVTEAVDPFRHAASPFDLREIRDLVERCADPRQEPQSIDPQRRVFAIYGYMVEEFVNRTAKLRQRRHRDAKLLVAQRTATQTFDLRQSFRQRRLRRLAQQRGVGGLAVAAPVLFLLDSHDVRGAAIGGQQIRTILRSEKLL